MKWQPITPFIESDDNLVDLVFIGQIKQAGTYRQDGAALDRARIRTQVNKANNGHPLTIRPTPEIGNAPGTIAHAQNQHTPTEARIGARDAQETARRNT